MRALRVVDAEWTHDHVLERIGGGLKAVVLSSGRLGPKTYGSSWPATFRELPPLAELEQWLELRRDFEAAMHARNERPSAEEIALADEALAWPARYLADAPLQRDAVWLTARTIAFNLKLEKLLRERRIAADLMVEARKAFAPDIVRIYEDDAQEGGGQGRRLGECRLRQGQQQPEQDHPHQAGRANPVQARDPQGQGGRAHHARQARRRDAGKAVQPEPRPPPPRSPASRRSSPA